MFSTPLTSCSIGVATVVATTCAFAPGYTAVTSTVGGATSGYCESGSCERETAPIMTMTSERTVAKIGRSTKKRVNIVVYEFRNRGVRTLIPIAVGAGGHLLSPRW